MKEMDLNVVAAEAARQIEQNDYDLTDWCGKQIAAMIVTNIYVTNDVMKGYGQDLSDLSLSVISSKHRISIIFFKTASMVKSDVPICGYESLEEDIYSILVHIQACFDRLDY